MKVLLQYHANDRRYALRLRSSQNPIVILYKEHVADQTQLVSGVSSDNKYPKSS